MPKWLLPTGRAMYAVGLIGIGVQHFFFRDFIPVVVALWPAWMPARALWACLVGLVLVLAGMAILLDWKGRRVAAWTGAVFLLLVLAAHIPGVLIGYPAHLGSWSNAFKALALAGGAWTAALSFGNEGAELPEWLVRALRLGRCFFAGMLVVFGVDHFLYAQFVASLVPAWVGSAMFWTYLAGVALIAVGMGMMVGRVAGLASLLVGGMIFLWLLVLHIPRAIADPRTGLGNEWTSVFEALAFSGIGFMLAVMSKSESGSS